MCHCVSIQPQTYKNQVVLSLPRHMVKYKKRAGGDPYKICVDKCLKNEILNLWNLGITTTGCCCGHNNHPPYIGVVDDDIEKMKSRGYKVSHNKMRPRDQDSFEPKTKY